MTREQYEAMSDVELDNAIAEKVMGWTVKEGEGFHGFKTYWFGSPDRRFCYSYRPSTDHGHAFEVEEEIRRKDFEERCVFALCRLVGVPEFSQTTMARDNWCGRKFRSSELFALAHASPRQRCIAAMMAVEVKHD